MMQNSTNYSHLHNAGGEPREHQWTLQLVILVQLVTLGLFLWDVIHTSDHLEGSC